MTREEFDHFCKSLKATTNVIQWGEASVWKIGGKIFAICSGWGKEEGDGEGQKISFKCSPHSFDILKEVEGFIAAPYLARAKWIQLTKDCPLKEDEIKEYITTAYEIICAKLTKKLRKELGLE